MDERSAALIRRTWPRQVLFLAFLAVALFAPTGTLGFWQAWLYGVIFVVATSATGIYFLKHDPALVERRMAVGPTAEKEPAQKIIMTITSIGFFLLIIVPGFDYRWHWSAVPPWLVLAADGCIVASFVILFVVMKQNSYAAATIRVEADQPVISTGVYAVVRHPMYAGALPLLVFTPLALGSYWTMLVLIPLLPVLIWRLIDEERFLSRNLPGYDEYCGQTRYRLIPGVW